MKIIDTSTITPEELSPWEVSQVYNGLDCCITAEVLDQLLPQFDEHTSVAYEFSKALQGPVLEMRLRGVLIDQQRKQEVLDEYFEQIETLNRNLERIVFEGIGLPGFNWRSNPDLQTLFYDFLHIPVIRRQGRPTVDRNALEQMEQYQVARPIVNHIKAMRDIGGKIKVLKQAIDPDGRMRTSLNIAGTDTFRFSSSFSEFGTGGNFQNVEESLRSIFIADPGMKFAKVDGKQLQSRVMGAVQWNIFKTGAYLDACESADLHTVVAKMIWPGLPWTGDIEKDKEVAETLFYRHHSHRFMCKKLGHATNFKGKPPELSLQSRIPVNLIELFQPLYFKAFPGHQMLFEWVEGEIRRTGIIIGLGGRKRTFWGRRNDEKLVRDALAYYGQEGESWIVNNAMLNIWRKRTATVMMQDHDAITFMYPEEQEDKVIPQIMEGLRYPVQLKHGRVLEVPYDCKVGWNKGEWNAKTNPDGLKDYAPGDKRRRSTKVSVLDRLVR